MTRKQQALLCAVLSQVFYGCILYQVYLSGSASEQWLPIHTGSVRQAGTVQVPSVQERGTM